MRGLYSKPNLPEGNIMEEDQKNYKTFCEECKSDVCKCDFEKDTVVENARKQSKARKLIGEKKVSRQPSYFFICYTLCKFDHLTNKKSK